MLCPLLYIVLVCSFGRQARHCRYTELGDGNMIGILRIVLVHSKVVDVPAFCVCMCICAFGIIGWYNMSLFILVKLHS